MTQKLNIAIIMDGNRRWAVEKGLPKTAGHKFGAKKLEEVLDWCKEANLASLTLYTFSTENFNRSQEELDAIFSLFKEYFAKYKNDQRITEEGVRIKFLGDLSLFPSDLQDICAELEDKTKDNSIFLLQFCFGYGGRNEITHAVKQLVKSGEEITKTNLEKYLYTDIQPDILIRTSGEQRLSNFLPWQSTYSELFFIQNHWPAFTKEDFISVLDEFSQRQRRRGK